MGKSFNVAGRLSVLIMAAAVSLPAPAQVTLEECFEMAEANYPDIRKRELIEASGKYDLAIASQSWIPQFSINGKASWQSDVVEMPFEIPGYDFNLPNDQYAITGDITQQIWDGGVTKSRKELVEAETEVQKSQVEVSLYSLRSRVQNIFLGILLLDEQLKQNDLLRKELERNLDEVESLLASGMAYGSDRDVVSVNMLNCEQQRLELVSDRESYVRMLGLLTGRDMSGETFVVPSDEQSPDTTSILRPELALYEAQLRQADMQLRQLNTSISPKFNLNVQAGYGRPGLNMLKNGFEPYLTAGIKMQWNFGALYSRKNDIRKIRTQMESIESDRRTFLLNTSVDLAENDGAVRKAREMLENDERIIGLRESIRRSGEEQYRNGTLKMTDLMDMIDDEHDARISRSIHHIQLLMAIYDMRNTLGK